MSLITSSNDEMIGVLCHIRNVILADKIFNDFYFYLIPMFHEKALLGADFISCCEFVHKKSSYYPSVPTMYFQKFSENQYMCNYRISEKSKALEIDSLSKMVKINHNGEMINVGEMLPMTSFEDLINRNRKS